MFRSHRAPSILVVGGLLTGPPCRIIHVQKSTYLVVLQFLPRTKNVAARIAGKNVVHKLGLLRAAHPFFPGATGGSGLCVVVLPTSEESCLARHAQRAHCLFGRAELQL